MALLFGCTVRLGGFIARETGWRSQLCSTGAPCSEVGVGDSGNRSDGGSFMVQATRAWDRFCRSGKLGRLGWLRRAGDLCSEV